MLFRLVFPYSHSQSLLPHLWPHVVVLTYVCLVCSYVQLQHYSDRPFCIYSQTLNNTLFVNTRCSPYLCLPCVQPCTASCCTVATWWRRMWYDECWPRWSVLCSWWDSECWLSIAAWILIGVLDGAVRCPVQDGIVWGVGWCHEVFCPRWDSELFICIWLKHGIAGE